MLLLLYIAINNQSFSISLLVTTSLNYDSSCVHFGGIQNDKIVILYLEKIYFFSFFLGNYSFFTWVFSASGSCWTFERRVSAVVCTPRLCENKFKSTSTHTYSSTAWRLLSRPWCKGKDSISLILSIMYCHIHRFGESITWLVSHVGIPSSFNSLSLICLCLLLCWFPYNTNLFQ